MKTENAVIVGGGPAGLAAAVYLARADLNPLVIAGLPTGGQLMLTTEVENYPGIEKILGPQLILNMRKQAERVGVRFLARKVKSFDLRNTLKRLILDDDSEVFSDTVLFATGASSLWLGLKSEKRLIGKGVGICANCDGPFFKGMAVAVVGGGDTAMEEALTLARYASKVYIIHRREEFRASKIMQKKVLSNKKIEIIWNSQIIEVLGKDKVTGVKLETSTNLKGNSKTTQILDINGLFLAIGHKPNTDFLKNSGLIIDKYGYLIVTLSNLMHKAKGEKDLGGDFDPEYLFMTNVKGVFAAGEVIDYTYRQVATSSGMGVAAALEIERFLNDN